MLNALLTTKYTVPTLRSRLVARQRLVEALRLSLRAPLTLISAPPGFGKTTAALVAGKALQADANVALAWLTLDDQDNDSPRFWRYVIAALGAAAPHLETELAASEGTLDSVLNIIAAQTGEYLLVLDDYHVIVHPGIHQELVFFLEHASANLHLLIATRADPPISLHRMRARGQLVEVRASDLRFDRAEATAFLQDFVALALTEDETGRLIDQTEGWAAGLQLAALALRGMVAGAGAAQHEFVDRLASSNRYVLDYLAEEVLSQQLPEVKDFLLQTAILARMCGPLCDAVTGGAGGADMLELLARRNLFVTTFVAPDTIGGDIWYRYHGLFADLLLGQLRKQQPDLLHVLHTRAAEWFEKVGYVEMAVDHALAGENFARAGQLIERHASAIAMDGRVLVIDRWQRLLPEHWRKGLPRANLAFAWALLVRGRYQEIEPYLKQAEAALNPDNPHAMAELYALYASLADSQGLARRALDYAEMALAQAQPESASNLVVRATAHMAMAGALRTSGDAGAAIREYEQALTLCTAANMLLPALLARAHLSFLYTLQGRLRQAEAITRPVVSSQFMHPIASSAETALGSVLIEWNQLDTAEKHLNHAMELAQKSGHNSALAQNQVLFARLRRIQGDPMAAQAALDAAASFTAQGVPGWIVLLLEFERVALLLSQGALNEADHILGRIRQTSHPLSAYERHLLPLAQARVCFEHSRHDEACNVLNALLAAIDSGEQGGRVIEALALRAIVHAARANEQAARNDLQAVLALAEPEGLVRVFVDLGPPMEALLRNAADTGESPYARQLLEHFPSPANVIAPPMTQDVLTEREIDVLRLMACGLSYQQIADQLVLSINTVRHHVKGIYSKLHVETRTMALEEARRLNVL